MWVQLIYAHMFCFFQKHCPAVYIWCCLYIVNNCSWPPHNSQHICSADSQMTLQNCLVPSHNHWPQCPSILVPASSYAVKDNFNHNNGTDTAKLFETWFCLVTCTQQYSNCTKTTQRNVLSNVWSFTFSVIHTNSLPLPGSSACDELH